MSVPLLSSWLEKDKSTIYEQLLGLTEQGYLCKTYDSSYRLQLRSATYALTANGIKYLRDTTNGMLSETALRNMYKNRTASDKLVMQSLNTFKICLQLKQNYPDTFKLFTKSEMTKFEQFLRPLSDLYIQRNQKQANKLEHHLLEVLEPGVMTWILRKRIQMHQEFFEELEDAWDGKYPTLLFVCGNESTERRVQDIVLNSYLDFEVWTTTAERLQSEEAKVWLNEPWDDEDKPKFRGI